jgi:outer membrane cobalamin receptor
MSNSILSQNSFTLSGQVRNAQSNELVSLAVLKLSPGTTKISTTIDGEFKFKNLNSGNYILTTTCLGYKKLEIPIVVDGSDKTINIRLEEDITQLGTVTLVSDKVQIEEKKFETQGFAAKTISTKNVKAQNIELNTLIDQTPGISVRQTGGLGSRANYSINGLSGNAVRFFIDGIPMEYFGSSFSINSLPVTLIDNIEVYKGVVPISLGADALGGAVNIKTQNYSKTALNASYSIGSFNTHQASVLGNWISPKSNLVIKNATFYNYTDNNYKVWGNDIYVSDPLTGTIDRTVKAERFNDGFKNFGTKFDVGFVNKKWTDQFFLGILYSDLYKEIQHGATMEVPFGERYYDQKTVMPSMVYKKKNLIKNIDVDVFSGYSMLNRQVVDTTKNKYNWYGEVIRRLPEGGEAGRPTLAISEESTFVNRVNLNYNINEDNVITVNHLFSSFNRINDDEMADIGFRTTDNYRKVDKNNAGISYQKKSFTKRLTTNLFGKYYGYDIDVKETELENNVYVPSYFNRKDDNYGFGLATSYKISNNWLFQASYEKAIRLPSTGEIFGNVAENVIPEYELKPEKSENINLGFRYNTLQQAKHNVVVTGNLFYRDVRDLIQQSTVIVSGIDYFLFENLSKILSKGVDLDVKYNFKKKISAVFAASYTDARDKDRYNPEGRFSHSYNSRLKNAPYFQFNTGLRYNFENLIQKQSRTSVYWNTRYIHEFFRFWENIGKYDKDIIPTQFVNDIGVNYRFPKNKISMSLDLRNLFNEQVFDNFAIQKPGRGLYFKINYQIL